MSKQIFINLAVADLTASRTFYEAIGATHNPDFSDDSGICMVLSESIYFMLLSHDKYRQFTPQPIADAKAASGAIYALSRDSREAVDAVVAAAAGGGGTADPAPAQDHGFMYGRSALDPDGHHFEFFWMDLSAALASNSVEA